MAEQAADAEPSRLREPSPSREVPHSHASSSNGPPFKRKFPESEDRIVWPPVVIIENTKTDFDKDRQQWMGLGNEEIRRFLQGFGDIQFGKVLAVYGPYGHRGKSLAVFPATPSGYMDAYTLTEMLARDHRGRRDWNFVSRDKDPLSPGKVNADGKKILYGYLATERDMNEVDRQKRVVKRWSMESYEQKVLQPISIYERETEEARKKTAKLLKEANQKMRIVEQNREIVDMQAAQFREMNEKIEAQKKREDELEARHRENFEERKRQRQQEKHQKLEDFKKRERSIRQKLENSSKANKIVLTNYQELAKRLQDGITTEKENHVLRIAAQEQKGAMDYMNLESEMEQRLAQIEIKFQKKQLSLQKQHNEQIIKFREKLTAEKEKLLKENVQELKNIEMDSQEAKTLTTVFQSEIERECIICFNDMVEEKLERALYLSCGHANICSPCAQRCWNDAKRKKIKPVCPTCKVEQRTPYYLMPPVIYK